MVYGGEIAVLATQHGKEQVIAPTFAVETGLLVTVPRGLDTDSLGTFTGEVPRPASLRDTLRMKARLGMAASGCAIGIASEGSFGPHPMIPFVAAGREAMIFIDEGRGGTPTGLTRAVVLGCTCCGHAWHRPRPDGRAAAPPAECPECNP